MTTVRELFVQGKALLKDTPQPALEAKLLLLQSLSLSPEQFHAYPAKGVNKKQQRCFYRLICKRLSGMPLAYLRKKKEFRSIEFRVVPGVFIPRPETELLVEEVIKTWSGKRGIIVDMGTGCGNIALSLAKELPGATIIATDLSSSALKVARWNASSHALSNVTFLKGDLYFPLRRMGLKEKCDFIVSNPPYVSELEWEHLQPEIKNNEPKEALVAGKTGMEFIEKLIKEAPFFLKSGGYLSLEMGYNQEESVLGLWGKEWKNIRITKDFQGIPRVVTARLK